ncbi:hypothetical protein [Thiolapillus sp.]|uniref:hypothetical protein n=1 Tax=Thiolapillus sp. TaxID=2017437 RepID=UPI003AF6E465
MSNVLQLYKQAREGTLPPGFDGWALKDNVWGISVAHVAAKHGNLPTDFDRWGLTDRFGLSVARQVTLTDGVHPLMTSRINANDLGKWIRSESYKEYLQRNKARRMK